MRILIITGDRKFVPGNPRYDLMASWADMVAVYWGRGSLMPDIPKGPYEMVTSQDPFWRGLFALRAARRLKARFNVQVHTDLRAQGFIKRVLARRVLRAADSVRVVSESLRAQVEALGVRMPIFVLPIYQDLSKSEGLNHQQHPRFKKTILWIGRFEREKDPLKAISILEDVRHAGIEAGLIMLGAGSLDATLKQRVQDRGLEDYVEFPGWQDPVSHLAQADVVVSTSHYEGFGASIVEALAAGVPVVAPDVGIAREAGAVVVERKLLASATIEALRAGGRGELRLPVLGKEAWAEAWVTSL